MLPEWEIWIDSNISPVIAKWLGDFTGYVTKSSYALDLHHKTDLEIYQLAKRSG